MHPQNDEFNVIFRGGSEDFGKRRSNPNQRLDGMIVVESVALAE